MIENYFPFLKGEQFDNKLIFNIKNTYYKPSSREGYLNTLNIMVNQLYMWDAWITLKL